jgi:hypothetical protein
MGWQLLRLMKKRYRVGDILTAKTVNQLLAATSANTPNEGVGTRIVRGGSGGFSVLAVPPGRKFTPSASAKKHPWKGSLSTEDETTTAGTVEGLIYDSLHSITKVTTIITDKPVVAEDWMCLELRISTGDVYEIENIVVQEVDYEPFTESMGEVLTTVVPLYKVVDDEGTLKIEQVARNNYKVVSACLNGTVIKTLAPS